MAMHIEKPSLPKGRGYLLKTSLLEPLLVGTDCEVILHYWTPQGGHPSVLWAEWWLPNENRGTTLYMRAGSLPADELKLARLQLEQVILPQFGAWLTAVRRLPLNSPDLSAPPRFEALFDGGVAHVSHTPKTAHR